ncbi:hypothetical protein K438DRAFT_1771509 [Mycena galopus ATCC 62051]|nr:hypothetical protein K438DRAFT_1771509 [Mycena galopus ATCC 62051]
MGVKLTRGTVKLIERLPVEPIAGQERVRAEGGREVANGVELQFASRLAAHIDSAALVCNKARRAGVRSTSAHCLAAPLETSPAKLSIELKGGANGSRRQIAIERVSGQSSAQLEVLRPFRIMAKYHICPSISEGDAYWNMTDGSPLNFSLLNAVPKF